MTTPHYYIYPFGQNADDLTAIPDSPALDGSVSYFYGWTDPYEYDLTTNPSALPIPRGQMNQLFFDITNNIQEYQQYGTPQWVVGNTVSYPIYARVYYLAQVYESQIGSNTNTPGTDNTWAQISAGIQGVPVGTMLEFAGGTIPSGYLLCDGTEQDRTTYAALKTAITQLQNGTTINTMTSLSGLTDTSQMYVGMKIEGAGIQAGTTIVSIVPNTSLVMSLPATASATVPVTFFNWGNGDGSTTFNVPDMRRRVGMGSGGSPSSTIPPGVSNVVGNKGGEETHTLTITESAAHFHTPAPGLGNTFQTRGATPTGIYNLDTGSGTMDTISANTSTVGGNGAHNNIQPVAIVNYIIKF